MAADEPRPPRRNRPGQPPAGSRSAPPQPTQATPPPVPSTAAIVRSTALPRSATAPAGPAGDAPPEQFGRYRILRPLGGGGMGCVFLAHDTQLDRQVALKVPKLSAADDPEAVERFLREARAAATLEHPNLCPVYDFGAINGRHYLTMAFIEGRVLSDLIGPGRPLEQRQAAVLVRNAALALAEAHRRGVIHRDLKPANIIINRRGEPVIVDFGLARREKQGDARITQSGTILGTPAFMSPEQVRGDLHRIGPASDVYSLGVVLYQLITGELPFEGPPGSVLAQILTERPQPPSTRVSGVDRQLEAVCLKAMAREREERYAGMTEFAQALAGWLNRGQASREPPLPGSADAGRPPGSQPNIRRSAAASTPAETVTVTPHAHTTVPYRGSARPPALPRAPAAAPRGFRRPWLWVSGGAGCMAAAVVGVALLMSGGGGADRTTDTTSQTASPGPSPSAGNTAGRRPADTASTAEPISSTPPSPIELALEQDTRFEVIETPLVEVVQFLADLHSIEIWIDRADLEAEGISADTPVTAVVDGISLRSALSLILTPLGATRHVGEDSLDIISQTKASQNLETRTYNITSLEAGGFDTRLLLEVLTSTVEPVTWDDVGGPGSARTLPGRLIVAQTQQVHDLTRGLLEDLAAHARGEPVASRIRPAEVRIEAALAQPVTVELFESPLRDALDLLSDLHGITIWVKTDALDAAAISTDAVVNESFNNTRLSTALDRLLDPLGLAWLVEDEVLKITTRDIAAERVVIRTYHVADLLPIASAPQAPPAGSGTTLPDADRLIDVITGTVAPISWDEVGGAGSISVMNGVLVVAQTRRIQNEIGQLLTRLRSRAGPDSP